MESLTYEQLKTQLTELKIKIAQLEKENEENFTTIKKYHIQCAYNELKGFDEDTELPDNVWKKIKNLESNWNIEMLHLEDIKAFLDSYYRD